MAKRKTTVKPKAAADLAAKAPAARLTGAKATAKTLVDQVANEGEGTHLASANEEDAGKKDPIEKWGDPDAKPDQARRAAFGV